MIGCSGSQATGGSSNGTGTIQVSGVPQDPSTTSSQGETAQPPGSNTPEISTNLPTPGASTPAPQTPQLPAGAASGTQETPVTPPAGVGRSAQTDVLLFTGNGAWGEEVKSLKDILAKNGATYKEVNSSQLDAMPVDEIAKFGAMCFPGGSSHTQAGSLTAETHARLREAVQQRGVNYVGFCAGAIIAQSPAPAPGKDVTHGVGVVVGPVMAYYRPREGGAKVMATLTFPDGSTNDVLWYGGPITKTPGGFVVAKYPDGNPAISEVWSGKGFSVLSAVHPAATQATLNSLGLKSSDGVHLDLAWKLINAAIRQQPLPAF